MGTQEDKPRMLVSGKESSLEIFLFTNGQQDSPPRKYNVRVNDRWDTTLNFLARSQNGSNHTIELYTTEGKRVERGQDLTSGVAYVAVEPPHAFLPAGYNDYLMRASRSREKRQERISDNDPLMQPEKENPKVKIEDESKDAKNIKIIQEITVHSSSRTTVEQQDGVTNQVISDIAKAVKPTRRMSIKQPQKWNNSPPQHNNPHILKKNPNNVTPPIRRGTNPSKIDPIKKKVEISSTQNPKNPTASAKADSVIKKINESKSKGDEADVIGVQSRAGDTETVKNTDMASIPATAVTGNKSNQNYIPDATIIERNILQPISPEKEPRESLYIIPMKTRSIALTSNEKDIASVPHQDVKIIPDMLNSSSARVSSHSQAAFPKGLYRTESKADILNDKGSETFKKKTLVFGSQTNDNNFAIYVKQGNMVNLKVNIEVKNISNTTFEANHNQLSSSSVENTQIKKLVGETPAHTLAEAENYRDAPTLTEPWLAGLPYEQLQQITKDLRVAVCNCCSCFKNSEGVPPVYFDNNNYFILLPPEDVNEHVVSCTCKLEINQQNKCDVSNDVSDYKAAKLSGIENPDVKLDEGNNLPHRTFEIRKSCVLHEPVSIENQSLSENASVTEGEANQCECLVVSPQYQTCLCDCVQSLGLECPVCCHESATCSGVVKQNAQANTPNEAITLKDAFTQTDWGGIVLEARPREDGSYAFHIPSLKLLKNTNYLY